VKKNYTIPRAARVYGISEDELQAAIDSGELPLRPLRVWRLFNTDVDEWLIAKRVKAATEARQ
jgi:hypothetical protein